MQKKILKILLVAFVGVLLISLIYPLAMSEAVNWLLVGIMLVLSIIVFIMHSKD